MSLRQHSLAYTDYNTIDELYQSNFQTCHFGKEYEGTADYDNAASVWGTRWLLMWNLRGEWAALVSVSGSDF